MGRYGCRSGKAIVPADRRGSVCYTADTLRSRSENWTPTLKGPLEWTLARNCFWTTMAYTFTDHYRAARLCLRVDAVLIGLGLGLLLLAYPRDLFADAGITLGSAWTARVGGGALIGLGIGLLAASMESDLHPAWLLAAVAGNGAISISLLIAYFEGEMAELHPIGAGVLVVVFMVCILTVALSAPHIRRRASQQ